METIHRKTIIDTFHTQLHLTSKEWEVKIENKNIDSWSGYNLVMDFLKLSTNLTFIVSLGISYEEVGLRDTYIEKLKLSILNRLYAAKETIR